MVVFRGVCFGFVWFVLCVSSDVVLQCVVCIMFVFVLSCLVLCFVSYCVF